MVQVCSEVDGTGVCVGTLTWQAHAPGALPTLSIEDAQLLGAAFAFLFATAFVLRLLRKMIQES
jgi:hypothetical protein